MIRSRLLARHGPLLLIVGVGLAMRLWRLDFQSLWLDELHTMNEASPDISWRQTFDALKCCDPHPPLHFIIEKICFSIFGHTAFVGRMVSVLIGTASIAAMYWLGKELYSRSLGLTAATLSAVNFYNLYYSQEARPYIFAFLFAALSYAAFVRLLKEPRRNNAIIYALYTLGLLYSHYYSFFVVASQGCLGLLAVFSEKKNERKKLFGCGVLSFAIAAAGYIPWLPVMFEDLKTESFWINNIPADFLQSFFYDYFGNAEILKPLLLLLVFIYFARAAFRESAPGPVNPRLRPFQFGFVLILFWIFITVLIPYVRSLLVVPMLFPRYTIVILPAVLLVLAFGIETFRQPLLKLTVLGLFVVLSLTHILVVRKYYSAIGKTQFREMTAFIVKENKANFPIINEVTAWHQAYYLNRMGSKAAVLAGTQSSLIDSILMKSSSQYDLPGFWIAGAHGSKPPDPDKRAAIDTAYVLAREQQFMDAWAQLYVRRGGMTRIGYRQFQDGTVLPEERYLALWGGSVSSQPVSLEPGKYRVIVSAKGTIADGLYPHLILYANAQRLGEGFVTAGQSDLEFVFTQQKEGEVIVRIEMDNDHVDAQGRDRNVYISGIVFQKL